MILRKRKPCKYHKGQYCYIFSHGVCLEGWKKEHSRALRQHPLKTSECYQKEKKGHLTQPEAFSKAFFYWEGKNFLTGKKENFGSLGVENFHHILRKGRCRWFKYYPKNIVILNFDQHYLLTNGTTNDILDWIDCHPFEDWNKLKALAVELNNEYKAWVNEHPKEYKL
jgi:hypothetical protein